eukprot:TRINITY_DN10826_c0_g1_i1.p1 TRINITY_DN10826_c0_g1~~TRINITY_DN10826_c0_g1_i1.p1  ORF type:complete len:199 (-),score=33.42 TRINITY_DN10826_c0_g1_i1:88-684(-)
MENDATAATARIINDQKIPRQAKLMHLLLTSMGVQNYQPSVVNQLLELMYRYVQEILEESLENAHHRNSRQTQIQLSDVKLALQARVQNSFVQPPPRQVLLDIARKRNNNTFPKISSLTTGVVLPPDEHCLTQINYQVEPKEKTQARSRVISLSNVGSMPSPTVTTPTMNPNTSMFSPLTIQQNFPSINQGNNLGLPP